jgi:hypothetical protein
MKRLLGFVAAGLLMAGLVTAAAAQQPGGIQEAPPRLGQRAMAWRWVDLAAIHERVVATLDLTAAQREAVAAADRKNEAAVAELRKASAPLLSEPLSPNDRTKIKESNRAQQVAYEAELKEAMGEKFETYRIKMKAAVDEEASKWSQVGKGQGQEEWNMTHTRIVAGLGLTSEQKAAVDAADEKFRIGADALWNRTRNLDYASLTEDQRNAIAWDGGKLQTDHQKELKAALGEKFADYEAKMEAELQRQILDLEASRGSTPSFMSLRGPLVTQGGRPGVAVAGATTTGQETAKPEPNSGWGRTTMEVTQVWFTEMHNRVVAQLNLTKAQKEAVAKADKKNLAQMKKFTERYWNTPYSEIPDAQKEELRLQGRDMNDQYMAELKKAMGEDKFAEYQRLRKEELQKKAQAAAPFSRTTPDVIRPVPGVLASPLSQRSTFAYRWVDLEAIHARSVASLGLTAAQKRGVEAADKRNREAVARMRKATADLMAKGELGPEDREAIRVRNRRQQDLYEAELKKAMGGKFALYGEKMRAGIEKEASQWSVVGRGQQYEQWNKTHTHIVDSLGLTADQKAKVLAADKKYRVARTALIQVQRGMSRERTAAQMQHIGALEMELEAERTAAIKAAMGAKYPDYEAKMNAAQQQSVRELLAGRGGEPSYVVEFGATPTR